MEAGTMAKLREWLDKPERSVNITVYKIHLITAGNQNRMLTNTRLELCRLSGACLHRLY
jgi:hypothetical protein